LGTRSNSTAIAKTPIYFQKLIGPHPPTEEQCYEISQEIIQDDLVACSDGAYDQSTLSASHGWAKGSNTLEMLQATGASPVDAHPKYLSSFRAELIGIVAVLYLIRRICKHFTIEN
jgi:hypothetical protein